MTTAQRRLGALFARPSQQEIAEQLGVGPTTISHLLAGRRQPSLTLALRIERELGIPVSAWDEDEDDQKESPHVSSVRSRSTR